MERKAGTRQKPDARSALTTSTFEFDGECRTLYCDAEHYLLPGVSIAKIL